MTTTKKVNKQPTCQYKLTRNSWERRRVAKLNEAWSQLERCVPSRLQTNPFQRPSKLTRLKGAMEYISQLARILKTYDEEGSIEDSEKILMSQKSNSKAKDSEVKESPMCAETKPPTMMMENSLILEVKDSDDDEDSDVTDSEVTNSQQKMVECGETKSLIKLMKYSEILKRMASEDIEDSDVTKPKIEKSDVKDSEKVEKPETQTDVMDSETDNSKSVVHKPEPPKRSHKNYGPYIGSEAENFLKMVSEGILKDLSSVVKQEPPK